MYIRQEIWPDELLLLYCKATLTDSCKPDLLPHLLLQPERLGRVPPETLSLPIMQLQVEPSLVWCFHKRHFFPIFFKDFLAYHCRTGWHPIIVLSMCFDPCCCPHFSNCRFSSCIQEMHKQSILIQFQAGRLAWSASHESGPFHVWCCHP